ncbi:MAG: metallophosphoesterase family protein [Devosia sp.]
MRICHLSDLHFGHHDTRIADALAADVIAAAPDLVVVSGDFTQWGTEAEFRAARAFLDELKLPVFAVPGNHDVPARNLVRRFLDPYGSYRRHIAPALEPLLELDDVVLAGIKTSRRARAELNWAHGSISHGQLRQLQRRLSNSKPDALRIVVAHHPLMQPEGEVLKPMRLVRRADVALRTFAALGVRLVLSGHFHLSYTRNHGLAVAKSETTGLARSAAAPILVAQAGSAVSTRLRGAANGYNVIDIAGGQIALAVREWDGSRWSVVERDRAAVPPDVHAAEKNP